MTYYKIVKIIDIYKLDLNQHFHFASPIGRMAKPQKNGGD